jgi:hypothetical protein
MSPDRAAMSGVVSGVSFLAGFGGGMAISKVPFPRPGTDAADIRRYFGQRPSPLRVSGPGQLVSAAALGRFTASVAGLARRSGSRPLQGAAIAGGAIASGSLAVAAAKGIGLAAGAAERPDVAVRLHRRMFLAGGPIHGGGLGLLLGALGIAGLRTGELPPGLANAAIGAAVPNLLAPLAIAVPQAVYVIPAGRFPGLAVMGAAGVSLAGVGLHPSGRFLRGR